MGEQQGQVGGEFCEEALRCQSCLDIKDKRDGRRAKDGERGLRPGKLLGRKEEVPETQPRWRGGVRLGVGSPGLETWVEAQAGFTDRGPGRT